MALPRVPRLFAFLLSTLHVLTAHGPTGTPNPWKITGHSSVLFTGLPAVFGLVRRWLDQCLGTHARCGSSADSPLPTRVLDLGSRASSTIRLREPDCQVGRYICLTYCWGRSDFIKTTRDNIERHKQGIAFEESPRNFQDTVRIARALGVRYVWIDSLCIIQDDVNHVDWERESSRMADVYRNSYLTVTPT